MVIGGGTVATVTNNVIVSNVGTVNWWDGDGIAVWNDTTQAWLLNNTIAFNSAEGVQLSNACTVLVRNNIIVSNGLGIVDLDDQAGVTIDHNDVWNIGENYRNVLTGTGDISADPLFVDVVNGDYHLQVDSPCIDAGTSVGAPAHDIEGTPRDAAPDIGAYEWAGFRIFLPLVLRNSGSYESLVLPLEPGCELNNSTLCGALDSGGGRHGRFLVGDSPSNEGLQFFLSYDISGISAQSEIVDVIVDLTESGVDGSPFDALGCMGVYAYDYGTLDSTTYFTGTLEGAIAEYCSESELRVQVNSTGAVQILQEKLGDSRFQFRFQFEGETDNDDNYDWVNMESHPPKIIVHYRRP